MVTINIPIKVKESWDPIAKCYIMYSKKYDISAYGRTLAKAEQMLIFTILEILKDTKSKKKK